MKAPKFSAYAPNPAAMCATNAALAAPPAPAAPPPYRLCDVCMGSGLWSPRTGEKCPHCYGEGQVNY